MISVSYSVPVCPVKSNQDELPINDIIAHCQKLIRFTDDIITIIRVYFSFLSRFTELSIVSRVFFCVPEKNEW